VHERRLRALIAELDAAMPVWPSADLLPQSGEYERTLVTVLNAALASAVRDYYAELAERLSTDGFTANIYSARSDGALMNLRQAGETPVYTLLSGPAGAVAGAGFTTALAGYPDAIAFDMGGSATRIGLIRDGKPLISRRTALGPLPLAIAAVAIHPVAAGAATSAYIADGDVLQLGAPEPSGGPAGERASIAAANLVLGRLPAQLPGVDRTAQLQAATDAVARIAAVLAVEDSYQVAQGIIDMFNENLYGALREMAVQQAIDPHQFALVAAGGAGPLHANALAALAGCYPVIIPPTPGVLAALGLLCATLRQEFSCVFIGALDAIEPGRLGDRLNALGLDAEAWLTAAGVAASEQHIDYEVDARYRRQDREITLPVTADFAGRGAMLELRERFTTEHYRLHGFDSDAAVELVNLRAIGSAVNTGLKLPKQQQADSDASAARIAQQRVYFDGALVNMDIYQREQLAAGNRIRGPALIVQSDSTTLIHPQHTAAIDGYLNILIHPETLASVQEQPVWR
jgi:N-methylhydantoinase A